MEFRELNEHDTNEFLTLKKRGLESNPESFVASPEDDSPNYPAEVRKRLRNASVENGDIILGAFDPGLIGIISVTRNRAKKRFHKAGLHGMYVLPKYRGKGVGKTLLKEILSLAKHMKGLEEIQLIVAVENIEAYNLYQKMGFTKTWTEKHALKLNAYYVNANHMILNLCNDGGKR